MNEQLPPKAIEWTRVWNKRRGYTWNVAAGCAHECQWLVNGEVATCYAKIVAERVTAASYPQGFAHHYWHPERLNEPLKLKEPSGIFLDSMSDLMGVQVPVEQVNAVLDVCRRAKQHIFFLLTKNAPRLLKFDFPDNVWVGVSSAPDFMFGKALVREQQESYMHKALKTLTALRARGVTTWMSAEPLSWDISPIVAQYPQALSWAVIGAASNGRAEYPPKESDLRALLDVLTCPVFYKGNLRSLPYAAANWRTEFPPEAVNEKSDTLPSVQYNILHDTGEDKPLVQTRMF